LTSLYDITEQVEAEAALHQHMALLQEREARLRAIIEHAGSAVWALDTEYRLTMANTAFLAAERSSSGRTIELGQLMPPEWVPEPISSRIKERYTKALAGEHILEEQVTSTLAGVLHWWEIAFNPIIDEGKVIGITCFARDITARKQVELALTRSEALYRTITCTLPNACILVFDHHLRYQVAEGPALATMGFTREAVEGRTIFELVDEPLATEVGRQYREVLAGNEVTVERTFAERSLFTHHVPLRDKDGMITAGLAMVLDVTERKQLEAQLLQAQKMESVGRLAGGIAHDFNNLLTAIGGYIELALSGVQLGSQLYDDLMQVQHATNRAGKLTNQLLAFARRQPMELRQVDLNDLVLNLEQLLRRLLGTHIRLETELMTDLGKVTADSGQLEQVLINLAINARDAMKHDGVLTLVTQNVTVEKGHSQITGDFNAGEYVLLMVRDNGVGIPQELQAHVFEPFFTTKPVGQGSGLGLSICYGIVTQHGGAILLSSEVNRGTTFSIYLPRSQEEARVDTHIVHSGLSARGHETILIAEDEPIVRALAVRVLEEKGYTILEARDGSEALKIGAIHAPAPIHLFLSDVAMPKVNGPAAANRLRKFHPQVRTLFLSGTNEAMEGLEGLPMLHKPFTPTSLLLAVRTVLDS
jgi:PAS domain S-box-containing protein